MVFRRVNVLVGLVCGLFAAVIAVHIVLFVAETNLGNPFAHLVSHWADGVSFGLGDLFLTGNEKLQLALNQGAAAACRPLAAAAHTVLKPGRCATDPGGSSLPRPPRVR
ncbi:hypothetical protein SAMN06265360_110123 [Haloechinothrix alba]|uniref:Uncharacterized protein n=1 Tax=Haloechinothrix alba TaxID=664784 RepID=A0A238XDG2_9PSEU|nr:hypothetical protein [Haloechinothrix alba]SNR57046.1 hypothetical protein SAMN06265360_110123 [Haloechinothrix alba]